MENRIPYTAIKQITNDYDEKKILGRGGFGTVYEGVHEGKTIAVKVFDQLKFDDIEFQKEFDNLKGLQHRNIVQLVGFCNDTEEIYKKHEGKQVTMHKLHTALCLEYVQQGHLGGFIHDESMGIDWHTRFGIIKGICEGLKYLHEDIDPPLLHLDLKPQNILLDKDMVPKIVDFGLSRLFGQHRTIKTGSNDGTVGYMPPEYTTLQVISDKYDIYSLGVIMAKIIVGEVRFYRIGEGSRLEFINKVQDNWSKRLSRYLTNTSLEVHCNQVRRCFQLALDCMKTDRRLRPTIKKIVSDLIETETIIGILKVNTEQLPRGESFRKGDISENPSPGNGPGAIKRETFDFLKMITDNFSDKRIISKEVSGTSYKGILEDGQVISVLKFDPNSSLGRERTFIDLVHIHSEVNEHENIVKFIGYCRETRSRTEVLQGRSLLVENEETLLCHDFFAAGSLADYIYGKTRPLDWKMNFNMILGICRGLHYLHSRSFVHCDLHPENIFLDNNNVPKILNIVRYADMPRRKLDILASFAYLAPEYINRGQVSIKSDIYSLGVIILEIIAGVHYGEFDENVRENLTYEYIASTYPSLDACASNHVRICINIGLQCVSVDYRTRPTVHEILDMLNTLSMEGQYLVQEEPVVPPELFEVQPTELCFPLEPKKPIYCSLQLRNNGLDRIAFMLVTKTPENYQTKLPLCGIVPPSSTYTHTITMRMQPQQTSEDEGGDFFTLHRVALGDFDLCDTGEGSTAKTYKEFFDEAKEVQKVILRVNYHPPVQEPIRSTIEIITSKISKQVTSIDVHPTEPWIMTTHNSGDLRVFNYNTMEALSLLENDIDESVHVAIFVEREKWFVAGDANGGIHVYSYDNKKEVKFYPAHCSRIASLALHPLRPFLLSSSEDEDNLIKLWDWKNNWECRKFEGHAAKVMQVTFNSYNASSFTSASMDGTIKIWRIDKGDADFTLVEANRSVLCVENFVGNNQQYLIAGLLNGDAQIWNLEIKGCVQRLLGHAERITAVSWHPELRMLITGSFDGTVRLWNFDTHKLDDIINFNLGQVNALGFIKALQRIVVGCKEGIAMMEIPVPR